MQSDGVLVVFARLPRASWAQQICELTSVIISWPEPLTRQVEVEDAEKFVEIFRSDRMNSSNPGLSRRGSLPFHLITFFICCSTSEAFSLFKIM